METHGIKPGCCTALDGYITNSMLVPDSEGSVSMNILHQPGTVDTAFAITRVTVHYCPNCGKPVGRYDLPVPAPELARATVAKGSCNDVACRFCISNKCAFAFRNIGCYRLDPAARDKVNAIRAETEIVENLKLFVTV